MEWYLWCDALKKGSAEDATPRDKKAAMFAAKLLFQMADPSMPDQCWVLVCALITAAGWGGHVWHGAPLVALKNLPAASKKMALAILATSPAAEVARWATQCQAEIEEHE